MSKVTDVQYSHLSNDLFWSVYHRSDDLLARHFEKVTWTGYDDAYWWHNVAHTDDFLNRTCKCGAVLRLNLDERTVEVISEAVAA